MPSARAALTVLLACAVSTLGCSDAGEQPWDGSYIPLEERGDWVDTGPLSTCGVLEEGGAACGSLESFDLRQCRRGTLKSLERWGIFRAELRYAPRDSETRGRAGSGGFKLGPGGVPESVFGVPPVAGLWDSRTLLLSGREGDTLYTFVGCNAVDEHVLTGCFSVCRNGRLEQSATFRAERMMRFEGEREASGGLRLLSESSVRIGRPVDVHVSGSHAYVVSRKHAGRPGGLTIFDVSDPSAPVLVGSLSPEGADWRNAVSGEGTLYVATANHGVAVVDISQPSAPTLRSHVPGGPLPVSGVNVAGERLYAIVESPEPGTLVFDISEPGTPHFLVGSMREAREPNRLYSGRGATPYEGRLYINHQSQGLKVVDGRDPSQLSLLGKYTYPYARSAASAVGTFASRIVAFELGRGPGARLRVLDATVPSNILKMSEYGLRHVVSPHTLQLRGSRLYLTYHHEGLRVLDVSNPSRPSELAYFNSFRETDPGRGDGADEGAAGLHVPGDGYVYVVDTARGLLVLNELR
ncbi:hypothetical protein HPC49_29960 [Pyxidicoccus fallax]|uniref:FHA domain-containing protein n=1 Tax=Pyxidicoccus fallax TaxID=394095 RepID=A0A848LV31_9BACT|nr:hypothetical protein [Pyxidicoccus fallax]NMO21323.1 hypothetical protein [Pyxidicoccus fallax]NPC82434.1 hypothetical protein [Pyxidicoccus fallax]